MQGPKRGAWENIWRRFRTEKEVVVQDVRSEQCLTRPFRVGVWVQAVDGFLQPDERSAPKAPIPPFIMNCELELPV